MPSIELTGIRVINRYKEPEDIYIGRGSPLGNPYPIGDNTTREQVIEKYKDYLMDQISKGNQSIINALNNIKTQSAYKEVKLGCFCKPKSCHGDVIKDYLEQSPINTQKKVYAFTGHRPNKLNGYQIPNPTFDKIYSAITELLIRDRPDEVISGMALGVDQWACDIAQDLHIPVTAAIPFIGQEAIWPEKSKAIYRTLLGLCTKQVIVSEGEYSARKLQVRNEWMVNHSTHLVAVWNGSTEGGTYNCIKYAQKVNKEIIFIPL